MERIFIMKKKLNTLLQDLQDTYVSLMGLPIIIFDNHRIPLTTLTSNHEVSSIVKEKRHFVFSTLEKFIMDSQNEPIVMRSLYHENAKEMIFPILIDGTMSCLIWSGPFIEKEDCHSGISSFTAEQVQQKFSLLKKMADICKVLIEFDKSTIDYDKQLYFVKEASKVDLHSDEILSTLLRLEPNLDFVAGGLIERNVVKVTSIVGKASLDPCIPIRGSFFEEVYFKKKLRYWDNLEYELRTADFNSYHESLQLLVVYPLMEDNCVIGFMFFGSYKKIAFSQRLLVYAEIISQQFLKKLLIKNMLIQKDKDIIRQNAISQFSTIMINLNDPLSTLNLIAELAHRQINSVNTAIILNQEYCQFSESFLGIEENNSIVTSSKYIEDIKERFFNKHALRPSYFETAEENIIECPIYIQDNVFGVLCVSIVNSSTIKMDEAFLQSLTTVGGIILEQQLSKLYQAVSINPYSFLNQIVKDWNNNLYQLNLSIKQISKSFALEIQLNQEEISLIEKISDVCGYSLEFLEAFIIEKTVLKVLNEYHMIMSMSIENENKPPMLSTASQIVALVSFYLRTNKGVYEFNKPELIDYPLYKNFSEFISKNIELINKITNNEELVPEIEKMNNTDFGMLTKREQEIAELILKGCNNKEISQTLYISIHTVKNHVTNIFKKIGVSERSEMFSLIFQLTQK